MFPEDIEGGLETIGGLEDVKQTLADDILIPLERPELFDANPLLNPPRGILLYGRFGSVCYACPFFFWFGYGRL